MPDKTDFEQLLGKIRNPTDEQKIIFEDLKKLRIEYYKYWDERITLADTDDYQKFKERSRELKKKFRPIGRTHDEKLIELKKLDKDNLYYDHYFI